MPFSTIFQLYRGGQFYWWRKAEYLEKTIDLQQTHERQLVILIISGHKKEKLNSDHQMLFFSNFNSTLFKKKQLENVLYDMTVNPLLFSD
jgi:hypothetical protein